MKKPKFTYLPDEHWKLIKQCLDKCPFPKVRGQNRADMRKVWNSILYVLIRGCRWRELPRGKEWAPKTTAHRWLKKMRSWQVFDMIFLHLLKEGDFREKIDWQQLNIDGSFSPRAWRRRGSGNRL